MRDYDLKYLLLILPILVLSACSNNRGSTASNDNVKIQIVIVGEWISSNCMPPGEVVPQQGAYSQKGIVFTETEVSNVSYHYADSECVDYEFENHSTFEEYSIGNESVSASGLLVNAIDWENSLEDVTVTSYQIITVIDDQLYLGIPNNDGGNRSTEIDFEGYYQRTSQ